MNDSVFLMFEPEDYVAAKDFVIATLGASNVDLNPHGRQLKSAQPVPELLVTIGKIGIPALASLVAIWLGKGKRVIVKVGTRQLNLTNMSDATTEKLVREFLSQVTK